MGIGELVYGEVTKSLNFECISKGSFRFNVIGRLLDKFIVNWAATATG